jgi:hypothetical protein
MGRCAPLVRSPYYSVAQEILAAEANPGTQVKVGEPWYKVIPTTLVRLRGDSVLPEFRPDVNGVWDEKRPEQP